MWTAAVMVILASSLVSATPSLHIEKEIFATDCTAAGCYQQRIARLRQRYPRSPEIDDIEGRCEEYQTCTHKNECDDYQRDLQRAKSTGSQADSEKLLAWKDLVCNRAEDAVCCESSSNQEDLSPQEEEDLSPEEEEDLSPEEEEYLSPDYEEDLSPEDKAYLPKEELREGEVGDLCGSNKDSSRVVGGDTTKPGTFPSAALLGSMKKKKETDYWTRETTEVEKLRFHCGGTLINRWYVLTAAHCNTGTKITRVALGDWDTSRDPDSSDDGAAELPRRQLFEIQEKDVIKHPNYKEVTIKARRVNVVNDIALVKLPRQAVYNSMVQPICLILDPEGVSHRINVPDLEDGLTGKRAVVVGWGYTNGDPNEQRKDFEGGTSASIFQQYVDLPIIARDECYFEIEETQVCAGGEEGKDSCNGDSGGPLYISEFSPRSQMIVPGNIWYLLGVVSFGNKECATGLPAVYTRVQKFVPWIKKEMKKGTK